LKHEYFIILQVCWIAGLTDRRATYNVPGSVHSCGRPTWSMQFWSSSHWLLPVGNQW